MTNALMFGQLCPWCARKVQAIATSLDGRRTDPCCHPLIDLGDLELHRIPLPYPDYPRYPALSLNLRGNRWDANRDVQAVRADVSRLAHHIRPGRYVVVHLAWAPRRPGTRDVENLTPLLKAICDGLARGPRRPTAKNPGAAIGLDLVPDDTSDYMDKLMPVILPKGDPPGMWLTVAVAR